MTRSRQITLLALLAGACVAGLWGLDALSDSPPGESRSAPLGLVEDPADETVLTPGASSGRDELAAPGEAAGTEDPVERTAVADGVEDGDGPPPRNYLEGGARVPAGSLWLEGRVELRPGTPLDETVWVEARGRRFGGKKGAPRRYRAPVSRDGRFRVAFSGDTRKGFLDVEARYHYLEKAVSVARSAMAEGVVLEPKLGGALAGICTPSVAAARRADVFAGVSVTAISYGSGALGVVRRHAPIDEEGRYLLGGLPPGAEFHVSLDGRLHTDEHLAETVVVRPGETVLRDFDLVLGMRLAGRVVDPQGEGVGGARIVLFTEPPRGVERAESYETVRTEPDGTFEALGLPAGSVNLDVSHPEFEDAEQRITGLVPGGEREGIVVRLRLGMVVEGVVRWPDGAPARDAWVKVELPGGAFFGSAPNCKTGADGRFTIAGLETDSVTLTAMARRTEAPEEGGLRSRRKGAPWRARLEDVRSGVRGLVMTLAEGDRLTGRVSDDLGEPVGTFRVSATPDGGGFFAEGGVSRVFRGAEGEFELEGLEAGAYEVVVRARGHGSSPPQHVDVPYAGPALDFVLPRAVVVAGSVVDGGGAPVAGAQVVASFEGPGASSDLIALVGASSSGGKERTNTDDAGAFEFPALSPGLLGLVADADGHARSEEVEVQLAPGGEVEGVVLVLRLGARLTGEIHGAEPERSEVKVTVAADDDSLRRTVETDEAGRFELLHLPGGRYEVTAALAIPGVADRDDRALLRRSRTAEAAVTLAEGGSAHVVLGTPIADPLRVRGRVTFGGEGVDGVVVTCRMGDLLAGATTDEGGRYELDVDGPGEARFSLGGGWGGSLERTVTLGEGPYSVVDFALPTASIQGVVRGDDGPLAGLEVTLVVEELADPDGATLRPRERETDAEGSYEFSGLPPGTYTVQAGGGNGTWWWGGNGRAPRGRERVTGIELAAGARRSGVDFDLAEGGSITGDVFTADGDPAGRVRIEVTFPDGSSHAPHSFSGTDETGHFVYRGLAAGTYRVRARDGGGAGPWVEVEVDAAGDGSVRLELPGD
ncbi:MAG: carboxypeptidase-like regulatory domain-containing protein [Planctomycetota bacterium]|jgi:hypothetical protein|nr:carboxypeptidase-like regulatory domain-containing protein [Planctomycetota bacterium]MDP6762386.1 carboxypeptidase-like regulatory domain-containing protein [Planctomycetota bacterium]MDP6988847.1 carboxypeptidase-like regulatory domain-containing protein [Planctomycetota bacterium]